jgi:hypothetical protein
MKYRSRVTDVLKRLTVYYNKKRGMGLVQIGKTSFQTSLHLSEGSREMYQ